MKLPQKQPAPMCDLEYDFLCACHELVFRQTELLPELARALDVERSEIYYTWMLRTIDQIGSLMGGEWNYFFHGLECDLTHSSDGRFVRVDFGPHGRTDTFTGWGVLQFVMTSKAPWRSFPDLQAHLAEKPPPYDHLSGSHARMRAFTDRLELLGFLEPADPELCSFVEQHTTIEPSGRRVLTYPDDLPDRTALDTMVCYRWVLTTKAQQALARGI